MAKEPIKFTRAELYDKIWSRPATKLAEELGISGHGLGKDVRPVQYSGASTRLLGETCGRETYSESSASTFEAELARRNSH